ncbi:hypothetical protein ILYODFUR_010711 [Ilyodon furcidens]|uniref:Uncharacterized protein n=1 Tax=Ilyodon furcidens TaxID=33524 RepID=A0ABV0VDH9_9TELE
MQSPSISFPLQLLLRSCNISLFMPTTWLDQTNFATQTSANWFSHLPSSERFMCGVTEDPRMQTSRQHDDITPCISQTGWFQQ